MEFQAFNGFNERHFLVNFEANPSSGSRVIDFFLILPFLNHCASPANSCVISEKEATVTAVADGKARVQGRNSVGSKEKITRDIHGVGGRWAGRSVRWLVSWFRTSSVGTARAKYYVLNLA